GAAAAPDLPRAVGGGPRGLALRRRGDPPRARGAPRAAGGLRRVRRRHPDPCPDPRVRGAGATLSREPPALFPRRLPDPAEDPGGGPGAGRAARDRRRPPAPPRLAPLAELPPRPGRAAGHRPDERRHGISARLPGAAPPGGGGRAADRPPRG